jgi:hypothetical protein
MISLLLLVVLSFLGGLVMMLARTETGVGTTMRAGSQAFNAAEYGLNFSINAMNPAAATTATGTLSIPGASGVRAWSGSKDGSSAVPAKQGAAACPPGYSLSLGCQSYKFNATGQSSRFFVVTATTELESALSVYQGCSGTNYGC